MNALLPCDCTLPSDLHCHRNGTHPRCCLCCCCWVRLFSATVSAWRSLSRIVFKKKKKQQHHNMQQRHVIAELIHVWYADVFSALVMHSVMFSTSWRKVSLQETSAQWHFFFEKTSGKCRQTLALGLYCYTVFTPRLSGCPSVFRLILSVTDWRCETAEQEREQVEQGVLDTPTSTERSKMLGLPVVSTWVRGAEHVTPPEGFHRHTVTPRFLLRLTASTSAAGEPNGCCASDC